MRRFLLLLLLCAGVVAPSLAATTYYSTNSAAASACIAAYSSACKTGPAVDGAAEYYYQSDPTIRFWGPGCCGVQPPNSCPSGYSVGSGGLCVAAPPPPPSCIAPQILNQAQDACIDPPGSICEAGQTSTYSTASASGVTTGTYCDGTCEFSLEWNNATTYCWNYTSGGTTTYCEYDKVLPGSTCSASIQPATDPQSPTVNNSQQAATCPAGYSLNANGICEGAAVAGSASTTTSPGTSAVAGATTCPVGYMDGGSGQCFATAPNTNTGCPNGYTKNTNGICTATATLSNGSGASEAPSASQAAQSAVSAQGSALVSGVAAPDHGWTWVWQPPSSSCSVWHITAGGRDLEIDPCPTLDKIRALLSYAFAIMTMFAVFRLVFRPPEGLGT